MTPTVHKKEIIKKLYGFEPKDNEMVSLENFEKLFLEYNSRINLMSKNDTSVLFEKHIIDSLAIKLFDGFKNGLQILDVGSGGGFPSLIISIFFPEVKVYAMDSIKKKTDFLNSVKKELGLNNFEVINSRAENHTPLNVDILTNRAVGKINDVWAFSKQHLKKDGYFISYKAITAKQETEDVLKNRKELKFINYIQYELPLIQNYTRKLVILKKAEI